MTLNLMGAPPVLAGVAVLLVALGRFIERVSPEARAWVQMLWEHSSALNGHRVADNGDDHEVTLVHLHPPEDPPEESVPLAG